MSTEEQRSFDGFELLVAILLGLGAIGGAWSAYQGDLWGGQSTEAYGEAATTATVASTAFNAGVTQLVRDINIDVDAKKSIVEALFTEDPTRKTLLFTVASYLYAQQMSPEGYQALGLPAVFRTPEGRENAEQPHMPEAVLLAVIEKELAEDDAYSALMLKAGVDGFAEATRKFDGGRRANETGDKFGFDGVLFTVALFLAGIALVFKSRVRWVFAGLGFAVLAVSFFFLFTTPWAG
jgi:hypothetical protein